MHRTQALRFSLLASLGLIPLACSGTTRNGEKGNGTTGGDGRGAESTVGTGGGGVGVGGQTTSGGTAGSGTAGSGTAGSGTAGTGTAGTGTGTGTAGSPEGGFGGTGGTSFVCENPQLDPKSGLVRCDRGGYIHRPKSFACESEAGQPGVGGAGGEGPVDQYDLPLATPNVSCSLAEDCAQFRWGFCGGGGGSLPYCESGCVIDSDCGEGQLCICGSSRSPSGGECFPGDCGSDADCPGSICATHSTLTGCGLGPFRCITERDRCASDADCTAPGTGCLWNADEEGLTCTRPGSACGRPFLVADQPRLPPLEAREDWSDSLSPRVDHLTFAERSDLAAHWSKLGQMEHASIAAFARFSLQLLALGAPPELVEASTAALADETAHAKLCFGIASAYAGRAIGPGPLDISNSLELTSLAGVVDLVILEGCIGETSAALDALESADSAADPVIRDAYSRIAADELRHAELAFRFVRWAIQNGGDEVEARVTSALDSLPSNAATEQVVRPCLSALCEARHATVAAMSWMRSARNRERTLAHI